jgi:hypothetical protein
VDSSWQKKLRYRGFRLISLSLPILLLSLTAASFIPRRAPQILAEGKMSGPKQSLGRFVIPAGLEGDVPVTLALQWDRRPSAGKVELRMADPEGRDQLKKIMKLKGRNLGKSWQQTLELHLTSGTVQNFTLVTASREPMITAYRFTAFAGTPWMRILRIGEMLFFPALALVLLALVMILFPSFVQS